MIKVVICNCNYGSCLDTRRTNKIRDSQREKRYSLAIEWIQEKGARDSSISLD